MNRLAQRVGLSLIGAALGWVSLLSWRGLIEQPNRVIEAAFGGGLAIALIGGVLRARRVPWYAVLAAQVITIGLWLQSRTSARSGIEAWIPSPANLRAFVDAVAQGAADINKYVSPVSARRGDAVEYLLVLGLVVILAVDVLGVGLRRAPWAGLPVVVALTVPVSVLDENLSVAVFGICALLFVLLLAADETERVRTWARTSAEEDVTDGARGGRRSTLTSVRATAAGIGAVAAVGAFVLPALVPIGNGFLVGDHGLGGGGGDGNDPVRLVNPIVDLHRDLTRGDSTPLVEVETESRNRGYLRTTVLDEFDGERWKPSKRDLPARNKANGNLPFPPGLDRTSALAVTPWQVELTRDFETAWLPAPYPLAGIDVPGGDWRYDSRTLDFVRVDKKARSGVGYTLSELDSEVDADRLDAAPIPPTQLLNSMTKLPAVPEIVRRIAEEVTAGAETDYSKMVRLQDWFRTDGGFTYSLDPDEGSSSDALERFITDEKIGYCEQFAAAMAVMARSLGVPARVVVGFLRPDETIGTRSVYSAQSLHAWPEIYFQGAGWIRFEPTPASRTGNPPSWTRQQVQPTQAPSASSSAKPSTAPTLPQNRPEQVKDAAQSAGTSAKPWAFGALAVALVVVGSIPALLRRRRRAERLKPAPGRLRAEVAQALWIEFLSSAIDLGYPVRLSRSLRTVADGLANRVDAGPEERERLTALVSDLERARFGAPIAADEGTTARLAAETRAWIGTLRQGTSRWRRLLAAVAPRTVLVPGSMRVLAADMAEPADVAEVG